MRSLYHGTWGQQRRDTPLLVLHVAVGSLWVAVARLAPARVVALIVRRRSTQLWIGHGRAAEAPANLHAAEAALWGAQARPEPSDGPGRRTRRRPPRRVEGPLNQLLRHRGQHHTLGRGDEAVVLAEHQDDDQQHVQLVGPQAADFVQRHLIPRS